MPNAEEKSSVASTDKLPLLRENICSTNKQICQSNKHKHICLLVLITLTNLLVCDSNAIK